MKGFSQNFEMRNYGLILNYIFIPVIGLISSKIAISEAEGGILFESIVSSPNLDVVFEQDVIVHKLVIISRVHLIYYKLPSLHSQRDAPLPNDFPLPTSG